MFLKSDVYSDYTVLQITFVFNNLDLNTLPNRLVISSFMKDYTNITEVDINLFLDGYVKIPATYLFKRMYHGLQTDKDGQFYAKIYT